MSQVQLRNQLFCVKLKAPYAILCEESSKFFCGEEDCQVIGQVYLAYHAIHLGNDLQRLTCDVCGNNQLFEIRPILACHNCIIDFSVHCSIPGLCDPIILEEVTEQSLQ